MGFLPHIVVQLSRFNNALSPVIKITKNVTTHSHRARRRPRDHINPQHLARLIIASHGKTSAAPTTT